jgi:hypothetical protein
MALRARERLDLIFKHKKGSRSRSWLILLLFYVLVMSLKCYQCNKKEGNCKTGEKDCGALDMCLKVTGTDKSVTKSCTNQLACDFAKSLCKNTKGCEEVDCCDGNLCNASSSLKSITMLTFLAPLMAVARYLM